MTAPLVGDQPGNQERQQQRPPARRPALLLHGAPEDAPALGDAERTERNQLPQALVALAVRPGLAVVVPQPGDLEVANSGLGLVAHDAAAVGVDRAADKDRVPTAHHLRKGPDPLHYLSSDGHVVRVSEDVLADPRARYVGLLLRFVSHDQRHEAAAGRRHSMAENDSDFGCTHRGRDPLQPIPLRLTVRVGEGQDLPSRRADPTIAGRIDARRGLAEEPDLGAGGDGCGTVVGGIVVDEDQFVRVPGQGLVEEAVDAPSEPGTHVEERYDHGERGYPHPNDSFSAMFGLRGHRIATRNICVNETPSRGAPYEVRDRRGHSGRSDTGRSSNRALVPPIRAAPMVEAIACLVVADHFLRQHAQSG